MKKRARPAYKLGPVFDFEKVFAQAIAHQKDQEQTKWEKKYSYTSKIASPPPPPFPSLLKMKYILMVRPL